MPKGGGVLSIALEANISTPRWGWNQRGEGWRAMWEASWDIWGGGAWVKTIRVSSELH